MSCLPDRVRRAALLGAASLALAGCGIAPRTADRTAPASPPRLTATIADQARPDEVGRIGPNRGGFFYVAEVNGERTETNTRDATRAAGLRQVREIAPVPVERRVPAGEVRLRLRGSAGYGLAVIGPVLPGETVDGEVTVPLEADRRYRVSGVVDAYRHEVWLEDAASGQRVAGSTVGGEPPKKDAARMDEDAAYTCCNLRYEGNFISDANWTGLPFIPAGARIAVLGVADGRTDVLIDGRRMRIGFEYGAKFETRDQSFAKLVLRDDPAPRLAAYPAHVQAAIREGRVAIGMTRDQVAMSLGPPRADGTRSMTFPRWTYWTLEDERYVVVFGGDGLVSAVEARPALRAKVLADGAEAGR